MDDFMSPWPHTENVEVAKGLASIVSKWKVNFFLWLISRHHKDGVYWLIYFWDKHSAMNLPDEIYLEKKFSQTVLNVFSQI